MKFMFLIIFYINSAKFNIVYKAKKCLYLRTEEAAKSVTWASHDNLKTLNAGYEKNLLH